MTLLDYDIENRQQTVFAPLCLNTKGQKHVKSEIERLGLGWDLNGTLTSIEEKLFGLHEGFEPQGDWFYYEITRNEAAQAGLCQSGYGIFAEIEITSEMVRFERVDL